MDALINQNSNQQLGTINWVGFNGKKIGGWRLLEANGERYLVDVTAVTWKNLFWPTSSANAVHDAIRLDSQAQGFGVWDRNQGGSATALLLIPIGVLAAWLAPSPAVHPFSLGVSRILMIAALLLAILANLLWSRLRRANLNGKLSGNIQRVRVKMPGNLTSKRRRGLFLVYLLPLPVLYFFWLYPTNLWGPILTFLAIAGCQRGWIEGIFPGPTAVVLEENQ